MFSNKYAQQIRYINIQDKIRQKLKGLDKKKKKIDNIQLQENYI